MIFHVNPFKAVFDRWGRVELVEDDGPTAGAVVWNVHAFRDEVGRTHFYSSALMKTHNRKILGSGIVVYHR